MFLSALSASLLAVHGLVLDHCRLEFSMGRGTCLQAVPDVRHFSLVMQKERWFSLSSSMYKRAGKGSGCPPGPRPMLGAVTVARRM